MRLRPPDPPLRDDAISLRPWRPSDAQAIASACAEAEIARWLDQIPQPYALRHAEEYVAATKRAWQEGKGASFAILAERGEAAGSISVHWIDPEQRVAEVGYWVAREARGRGVATGALQLLARWAIEELGVERLQLRADVLNEPSQRVAEKAGFRREGVLRSSRWNSRDHRRVDFVMFSLLPSDPLSAS